MALLSSFLSSTRTSLLLSNHLTTRFVFITLPDRHAEAGESYLRTAAGAANQAAAEVWKSGTDALEAIVTGDEQHQEGAWFGPEALLPYQVINENDKRAAVEYDVEADSRITPGSTSPACQVGGGKE